MLKVKQFRFSLFEVNTYLAVDAATKEAAVIDPAMKDAAEQKRFDEYVQSQGIKITQIINTHLHLDHCFGENYVKEKYGVPVKAHIDDEVLGGIMAQQYLMFGMKPKGDNVVLDVKLRDGDIISIGESTLRVIHTPGHTQGGICLYDAEDKILFSGDTLFRRSVGRSDLPGGNGHQLVNSITGKLYTLPDDTLVLPGHNDSTTIGEEKAYNSFTR